MTVTRTMAALVVGSLIAVGCNTGETAATSTTPSTAAETTSSDSAGTTTPADAGPDTTLPEASRETELVSCDNAPEEAAIVCESYDLISDMYVDDITDTRLAEGAETGLRLLDGADSESRLVCVAPTEAFVPTCEIAADAADDTEEAAESMVVGMASFALDPNSGYFDPAALEQLQQEQEGQIEGIGALVSPEDQTIPGENKQCGVISDTCEMLIVSTIEGAPAQEAGLRRDDEIVGVDGESIDGWTVDEVTASVRGPSGTDVTLTIERAGEQFDVEITRAEVVIPIVEVDTFDDVGYVRLWTFTGEADRQFEEAIVSLLEQGVAEIVVDLRDNPGGFLNNAIGVTSVFLADGDVLMTQGPDETTSYPVDGDAIVPDDMPVTFVVNKGSASASEVVSAVLQERGRAEVAGEPTFGKNTVQQRFTLSNGGALKLTIARWLTPGGLDFGGVGVTPDIVIDDITGLDAAEVVMRVTVG